MVCPELEAEVMDHLHPKKKGEKKVIVKTADEVIRESDILLSMNAEDAKTVGYTIATEAITEEKKTKRSSAKRSKAFSR